MTKKDDVPSADGKDKCPALVRAYGKRIRWLLTQKLGDILTDGEIDAAVHEAAEAAEDNVAAWSDKRALVGAWMYRRAYSLACECVSGERLEPACSVRGKVFSLDEAQQGQMLANALEDLPDLPRAVLKADLVSDNTASDTHLAMRFELATDAIQQARQEGREALSQAAWPMLAKALRRYLGLGAISQTEAETEMLVARAVMVVNRNA